MGEIIIGIAWAMVEPVKSVSKLRTRPDLSESLLIIGDKLSTGSIDRTAGYFLFGIIHRTGFPDNGHFNLPGICHLSLYPLGNFKRH